MFCSARSVFVSAAVAALLLCTAQVDAVPLSTRQIGNLQCNIDRGKTVLGLTSSQKAVGDLAGAGVDNSTVSAAKQGLDSADDGVKTIGKALLSGQTAPADARTQVQDGLTAAMTALSGVNATDAAATAAVSKAQDAVNSTITAGQGVVANCK